MSSRFEYDLYTHLIDVILNAGQLAFQYHGQGVGQEAKDGPNLSQRIVTPGDKAIDAFLRKEITGTFPDISLYSEEAGWWNPGKPYLIVQDAIDGSKIFDEGSDFYSITLAVQYREGNKYETIFGFTLLPHRHQLFKAVKDNGAQLNDREIRVAGTSSLVDAVIAEEEGWDDEKRSPDFRRFAGLPMKGRIRPYSSAAVLAYIAAGESLPADERIDGLTFLSLSPHDYLASQLILEEAGGVLTARHRSGMTYFGSRFDIVASNKALHQQLREVSGV